MKQKIPVHSLMVISTCINHVLFTSYQLIPSVFFLNISREKQLDEMLPDWSGYEKSATVDCMFSNEEATGFKGGEHHSISKYSYKVPKKM